MHGLIFETSIYYWQDQPDNYPDAPGTGSEHGTCSESGVKQSPPRPGRALEDGRSRPFVNHYVNHKPCPHETLRPRRAIAIAAVQPYPQPTNPSSADHVRPTRSESRPFAQVRHECQSMPPLQFPQRNPYTSCSHTDRVPESIRSPVTDDDRFSTQSKSPPNRKQTAGSQMDRPTIAQDRHGQDARASERRFPRPDSKLCVLHWDGEPRP